MQCEVAGGPVPVGTLPAKIGENAPHNVFPDTAGDLDDLGMADIDRYGARSNKVECHLQVWSAALKSEQSDREADKLNGHVTRLHVRIAVCRLD